MSKKKTNATNVEKLHHLTNADWQFINKMLNKHAASIINHVNNFTCETYDSLWGRQILIEQLLYSMFELIGINPIGACPMVALHYVYHHNSLKSEVPGLYVKDGKLFDQNDKEIPMDYVYHAKEKGIAFHKVIDAYFNDEPEYIQHFDNDETNKKPSEPNDQDGHSSQSVETQAEK